MNGGLPSNTVCIMSARDIPETRFYSLLREEAELRRKGYTYIAGVDEAGRGPLAGPVIAAAVILRQDAFIPLLDDSKKLPAHLRESLFPEVLSQALAVGVGVRSARLVDSRGIAEATYAAMRQAVLALGRSGQAPEYVLVDGNRPIPSLPFPQESRVKGDSTVACIAAASIVAKVLRDRMMASYDKLYPRYGFGKHKGYGTAEHITNLQTLGPSPIHRRSFWPLGSTGDVLHYPDIASVNEDRVKSPDDIEG